MPQLTGAELIAKEKLLQLLNDVERVEDFIKTAALDFEINDYVARELLRLISEAKSRALK